MLNTMSTKQTLANAVQLLQSSCKKSKPANCIFLRWWKEWQFENWLYVILLIPGISFVENVFWEACYISIRCMYTQALCDICSNFRDMESVFEI